MTKLTGSEGTLMKLYQHLYTANHLVPGLPQDLRDRIRDSFDEMLGRFHEEVMKYWNPSTLDDVREYEPSLQGHALVYLINLYAKQTTCGRDKMAELDELKDYLWDDEANAVLVLSEVRSQTIEDVLSWFQSRRVESTRPNS